MRKFTLLFMSMFLVLGTVMAQKEEESKDFNSPDAYPINGSFQEQVWGGIQLYFSEPVVVAESEVSIDVVNSNDEVVMKLTSCEVPEYNNQQVIFSFEKLKVEDEKGQITYQDQVLQTPGAYTYTIPAGLIKSADGTKEFEGVTYTFTVATFFPVEGCTPQETFELKEIVLTFGDQEITEVKAPETGWELMSYSTYAPVATITKAEISEDKKSVTLKLDEPITTPGGYGMNINPGAFMGGQYETNAYYSPYVVVSDPTPRFITNYENGQKVKELGSLMIGFMNVKNPEIAEGATIVLLTPAREEVEGTIEKVDYGFVVTFDADLTETGVYTFIIPENTFIFDGQVHEEGATIEVELYSFELKELEIKDVYPKAGDTVDKLESIIILFNQAVTLSQDADLQQISREIKLTCGDQEYTLTYNSNYWVSTLDQIEYLVNAEYDYTKNDYVVNPITAAGTYTLDASQIVVDYGAEWITDEYATYVNTWHAKNGSCEGTYSWTVSAGEGEGIKATEAAANGEQVIYDLLGRRVEKISGAGIYIVNGKKVVIK